MPGVRPPGTFVTRITADNPDGGRVYYVGQNYTATVVGTMEGYLREVPLGHVYELYESHDLFNEFHPEWTTVGYCPVRVRKYVREEYRARARRTRTRDNLRGHDDRGAC